MNETLGMTSISDVEAHRARGNLDPVRVVLVGHADDPRAWQCTAAERATCEAIFVVDRVVWVEGVATDPVAQSAKARSVQTRGDVEAIINAKLPGSTSLALTALEAPEATSVDPRFRVGIEGMVWTARVTTGEVGSDGTVGLVNVAVDDQTGAVLQQLPLPASFSVQPAALRLNEVVDHAAGGSDAPFYELDGPTGVPVLSGYLAWGTPALLIDPGSYVLRGWLARFADGVAGKGHDACQFSIAAESSTELALTATWPSHKTACTWATTKPDF